jgi:hypothetical protein
MKYFRYTLIGLRGFVRVGPRKIFGLLAWISEGFVSPSPVLVKQNVLRRWGGEKTWVETGTYLGQTTAFLARFGSEVVSIEPSLMHFENAQNRFRNIENVKLVFGYSEEQLEKIMLTLIKNDVSDVSFWLDGHYSGGTTVQGNKETPIREELSVISRYITHLNSVSVMIDDVRNFNPNLIQFTNYPKLFELVQWADQNKLFWTIEHDIFVATNRLNKINIYSSR